MPLTLAVNRAFLYGEASTTCSLLKRGKILFWEDHLDRLEQSWLSFYPQCSPSLLRGKIQKNVDRIPFISHDHYVKICLFTNDWGRKFDREKANILPNILLFGGEYSPSKALIHLKTFHKKTPKEKSYKRPYYLDELQDRSMAKTLSYSDILYISPEGFVLEASLSNVFFIYQDQVFTPKLSPFILAGIARKHFIQMLKKHDIPLIQTDIHQSELVNMEGVLLTNSLSQISMAESLDKRKLHSPLGKKLQRLYIESCEGYFNPHEKRENHFMSSL
ncbi:MAG: aminotransferase class IV [Bacteriovoracales bacterium]|nr:aminotransferase class IV [Bacteriovoracales bacterium]